MNSYFQLLWQEDIVPWQWRKGFIVNCERSESRYEVNGLSRKKWTPTKCFLPVQIFQKYGSPWSKISEIFGPPLKKVSSHGVQLGLG